MRIHNEEILSLPDGDWSEIITEIGYPHIPKTLAEKRRIYSDYLWGNVNGINRDLPKAEII